MSARGLVVVLALLAGALARAEDPARGEFAYGAKLATDGAGSVYALRLPLHVYQHTAYADLRDLRVLNGQSESVPYALSQPEAPRGAAPSVALPLFPLHGDPALAVDALRLKVTAAGASVEIINPAAAAALPLTGYLLDAQALPGGVVALELAWDAAASDFSARLSVEGSDDLRSWRTVAADAPIVSLHYGGQQFSRARLEFPDTSAKFLRLAWRGTGTALTGVTAQLRSPQAERPRTRTRAAGTAPAGRAGEYLYDLGGHFPVDRLSLALAEDNSLARVAFDARESPEANWRPQGGGTVYRLRVEDAPALTSAALDVPTCRCRFWRLRVLSPGGGLGATVPALVAGWTQDTLEFLARGPTPFEVVYGNSAVTASGASSGGLLAPVTGSTAATAKVSARSAGAGAPFEIGGAERLALSNSAGFRRAAVLWATLVVAVALLARMAWRLLKSGAGTAPP